jgi:hypothetical protein
MFGALPYKQRGRLQGSSSHPSVVPPGRRALVQSDDSILEAAHGVYTNAFLQLLDLRV